jgi:glycosyltransferase involved in cell wall biosynthesis
MAQISVIIPAYNAAGTISQCLDSVFGQSFNSLEVIVVNDGSTDATLTKLDPYRQKIVIINQANQGAAAARNRGAAKATGQFIIFWDADVIAQPTMLATMHQTLRQHPEASYAYSSFRFGFKVFQLWPFNGERLKKMPYIHTTSLIRRQDFPGFDPQLTRFQDWDLWLTMLDAGNSGYFIDQVLFRVRRGGTMSVWLPKFLYPLSWLKPVKKYQQAAEIIKQKHRL